VDGKPLFSELVQPKTHLQKLDHMMHDPALIKFISDQSLTPNLVKCDIRIYKFLPRADNKFGWHKDLVDGRTIGFSVNLTKEPFEGGVFHIRKTDLSASFSIQNLGYGDAIFFRIAPDLEHCVTTVTGHVERIACAGWFQV